MLETVVIPLLYLASAVCFILGLKQLSHPRTAPNGNTTAALGMLLAIVGTLLKAEIIDFQYIFIGLVAGSAIGAIAAKKVEMTSMPQLVALFNGFGGLSSLLVATSEVYAGSTLGTFTLSTVSLSILIGSITFSGSANVVGRITNQHTGCQRHPQLLGGKLQWRRIGFFQ